MLTHPVPCINAVILLAEQTIWGGNWILNLLHSVGQNIFYEKTGFLTYCIQKQIGSKQVKQNSHVGSE
jgi:hypothetical protein